MWEGFVDVDSNLNNPWCCHPKKMGCLTKNPTRGQKRDKFRSKKELMAIETPQDERLTSESCPCNSVEIDGFWHSPFCLSCRWFGSICRWIDICKLLDKAKKIFSPLFPFFLMFLFLFFFSLREEGGYLCYLDSLLELELFISDIRHSKKDMKFTIYEYLTLHSQPCYLDSSFQPKSFICNIWHSKENTNTWPFILSWKHNVKKMQILMTIPCQTPGSWTWVCLSPSNSETKCKETIYTFEKLPCHSLWEIRYN